MATPLRVVAGALLGLGMVSGAAAAPQVLALVATEDPVALTCERGECSAELSALCLQPDRASPQSGLIYTAAGGGGITLIAETDDGARISLPADGRLTVTAHRGHNAVKVSLPGRTLRQQGWRRVAVQVGDLVSLVPMPVAGDSRPQTAADIALATGPMRILADRIVEEGEVQMNAALITRDVINALPRGGRTEPADRDAAWQQALGATATGASEGARERARQAFDRCQEVAKTGIFTLRTCLGSEHDSLIGMINNEYRDSLNIGS